MRKFWQELIRKLCFPLNIIFLTISEISSQISGLFLTTHNSFINLLKIKKNSAFPYLKKNAS